MRLGLDADIHKLEAEKLRKGKNKVEEDLDSLKTDYKRLRLSMRTAGARAKESALEKSLLECQNEEARLKDRVAELERSLHLCRSHNSVIELKASLNKIEELKKKIGELEDALQSSESREELLERRNEQCQEQLLHSQNQIRDRDYVMGEAISQIREVADHLQALAVQADVLSLKYESESSRGRELAWLLRRVKALSIKAKPYM
ncbi:coiled-coil domain-containing protein 102A-like [Gossypium hirsutum]|uniref:Coiled-coil domain-containing protein 102A-like n=1 Tax=Gossypium hirsutum TaxID=3635 RepID=A0A1U8LNI8_GOSHI|nr:coiled-coil domain-containing protein 102A-like [Gossypium hirsutum]